MTEKEITLKPTLKELQALKELQEINKKAFQEEAKKDSTKVSIIKKFLDSVNDIQEIKKLQTVIDDVFWNKFILQKPSSFYFELIGKEFRATFGFLKNTIKIQAIKSFPFCLKFYNGNIAQDIILVYMVNTSPQPQEASFKDLVIENHVDFTAPILKDGV